jgi:DNA-directed RNA polymerase specialized sigma24 family protein
MAQRDSESVTEGALRHLYWLGYLLTGNSEHAVQALTIASWARRLVIASALARIAAELRASARRVEQSDLGNLADHAIFPPPTWMGSPGLTKAELERALLAIDAFPRCAVILTVFEELSIQDAAVLLNSDQPLVRKAQACALIDLTRNLAIGRGYDPLTIF